MWAACLWHIRRPAWPCGLKEERGERGSQGRKKAKSREDCKTPDFHVHSVGNGSLWSF